MDRTQFVHCIGFQCNSISEYDVNLYRNQRRFMSGDSNGYGYRESIAGVCIYTTIGIYLRR